MTIQEQIDQKESELSALKIELEAVLPHLSVLAEIESFADRVEQEARIDFAATIAKAKALF